MADVQLKNGYIKIANDLFEQLFIRDFSLKQLRILLLLFRFSYGFNKKAANIIPYSRFDISYIYKGDIKRELKNLELNRVINCDYENKIFSINKNYDDWKIPYHVLFDNFKLIQLKGRQFKQENTNSTQNTNENVSETLTDFSDSTQNTNPNVSETLTSELVNHEPEQGEKTQSNKDTSTNKDILNTYKDIYIIKDIYYDSRIKDFLKDFETITKKSSIVSRDERKIIMDLLNDLIIQNADIKEVTQTCFKNFTQLDFSDINFDPHIHWLLKGTRFLEVYTGTYTSKKDENKDWNSDDYYIN